MSLSVRQITPNDVALMEALLATFGDAFDDVDTYTKNPPSAGYLRRLLSMDVNYPCPNCGFGANTN
jgi:aminoglycoside 3-N-acetyltransferase I